MGYEVMIKSAIKDHAPECLAASGAALITCGFFIGSKLVQKYHEMQKLINEQAKLKEECDVIRDQYARLLNEAIIVRDRIRHEREKNAVNIRTLLIQAGELDSESFNKSTSFVENSYLTTDSMSLEDLLNENSINLERLHEEQDVMQRLIERLRVINCTNFSINR